MRRTMRLVVVLAAAAVMLTGIAAPTQGKGGTPKPPDVYEVICYGDVHYVTAEAADKSGKYQELTLFLRDGSLVVDSDYDFGTGLLEVDVRGYVDGQYNVELFLSTYTRQGSITYHSNVYDYC